MTSTTFLFAPFYLPFPLVCGFKSNALAPGLPCRVGGDLRQREGGPPQSRETILNLRAGPPCGGGTPQSLPNMQYFFCEPISVWLHHTSKFSQILSKCFVRLPLRVILLLSPRQCWYGLESGSRAPHGRLGARAPTRRRVFRLLFRRHLDGGSAKVPHTDVMVFFSPVHCLHLRHFLEGP